MPNTEADKKKITNPFGTGKNYLSPENSDVIGEKTEKVEISRGEIKIPIPKDDEVISPKEVLPHIQNSDTAGTNYLDPIELAKLKTIPNPDLEGVTMSSPLATKLDENVVKKSNKNKKIRIVFLIVSILLLFIFIFLSLVAFSVGRDNSLSSIAKSFPIENIPLVNLFVKSPELMIVDGLMYKETSVKGTEVDLKSVLTRNNKSESVKVNLKNSDEKYLLNVIDDKNTSIEVLVPSLTEQYIKFSISDLESYQDDPLLQTYSAKAMLNLYAKYNNKYIKLSDEKRVPKVSDPDFFKPENLNNGISELQADNLRIDVANIQLDLKPKLNKFFENELTKLNTFVKIKNMGRVKVRDFETFKINVEFTPEELEKYKLLLRPSLTSLLVDSSSDLARLVCHGNTVTGTENFSVDSLDKCIEDTTKVFSNAFLKDQSSFINSIGIKNVSMYSDIETGRLVKYEFTIYDSGKSSDSQNILSLEVIPLKNSLSISIPSESEKFKDFVKDFLLTIFSQLN